MKETPRQFEARTGLVYAPPDWLRAAGHRLGDDEPCPTLFRYPGAEALLRFLSGCLETLSPGASRRLWLASAAVHDDVAEAAALGTLALLEPLRVSAVRTEAPGVFLGVNERGVAAGPVVWVPPSCVGRNLPWDGIATLEEAGAAFGPEAAAERERVVRALHGRLESARGLESA